MTLAEARLEAAARLERHRVPAAALNAEVLLAHCLSVDRTYLHTHHDRSLSVEEYTLFEEGLFTLISGVPVQYILGRQEFYGRSFEVNPAVLIPRPETEYIVETVLRLEPGPGAAIIDVGTGSGCIGLTLALELPEARITVTDISFAALLVARRNAANLSSPVSIACMDLLDGAAGPFDFIVSNPPYVSPGDTSKLQREVRDHEPHLALFAEDDGFATLRRLIRSAEGLLKPGGYLVAEIGFGMEERTLSFLEPRWEKLPTGKDLQGIPRTIAARLTA